MKIGGKQFAARPVTLAVTATNGDRVDLVVAPLDPVFLEQELDLLPEPTPPMEIARDARGKVLRDDQGRTVASPNAEDPKFQRRMLETWRCRAARKAYQALQQDQQVEFDAVEPDWSGMRDLRERQREAHRFYGEVAKELLDCGLGMTALRDIVQTVDAISGMSMRENEELALRSFPDDQAPDAAE